MMKSKFSKLFYGFASCLFVIILLLPLCDEVFSMTNKIESEERRVLAKKPEFNKDSAVIFARQFEKYYEDNFGFRNLLVDF